MSSRFAFILFFSTFLPLLWNSNSFANDVNLNGKHTNAEEWSLVKTICLKAEVLIKKDIAKIAKKQKSVAQNLKGFSNEIGAIKSQLGLRKSLTEKINISKSRVSTDSAQLLNRMKVLFDKVRMELEMVVRKTRLYDCEEIFSRTQDEEIEIIKEGLESLANFSDTESSSHVAISAMVEAYLKMVSLVSMLNSEARKKWEEEKSAILNKLYSVLKHALPASAIHSKEVKLPSDLELVFNCLGR